MRVIWKHKWTIQTTGIKFSDTFKLLRVRVWREWHFHSRNEKKLMFPQQIFLTLSFKICCYYIKEDYLLVTIYFECFGYLFYSLWSGILNCWSTFTSLVCTKYHSDELLIVIITYWRSNGLHSGELALWVCFLKKMSNTNTQLQMS